MALENKLGIENSAELARKVFCFSGNAVPSEILKSNIS